MALRQARPSVVQTLAGRSRVDVPPAVAANGIVGVACLAVPAVVMLLAGTLHRDGDVARVPVSETPAHGGCPLTPRHFDRRPASRVPPACRS
jgi:hypothetical protein